MSSRQQTVYHFSASFKDLGKKWLAFSKLDKTAFALITQSLPDELKSSLPTVEDIEAELGGDMV